MSGLEKIDILGLLIAAALRPEARPRLDGVHN